MSVVGALAMLMSASVRDASVNDCSVSAAGSAKF